MQKRKTTIKTKEFLADLGERIGQDLQPQTPRSWYLAIGLALSLLLLLAWRGWSFDHRDSRQLDGTFVRSHFVEVLGFEFDLSEQTMSRTEYVKTHAREGGIDLSPHEHGKFYEVIDGRINHTTELDVIELQRDASVNREGRGRTQ